MEIEVSNAIDRSSASPSLRQRATLRIDDALPIAQEAERIIELIRAHQVLIVAGETGSGKTTQLPKLCLAAGRGVHGMIACTQPRRIAARSVARRVAEELETSVGDLVGFKVRFNDQVGPSTLIKFMTDGILLAETQGDRRLSAYDTIIVDEAHERSLNIDFLLGYLQGLIKSRPDLKLVITSATIDTERFAAHFGAAPIVNVEGRGFPVEVRWRPPEVDGEAAQERGAGDAIVAAVDEITRDDPLGDVLIFLSGEREIRDAHSALARRKYRSTEVLPLYARLSARDQDRVFKPGPGRRIVLATNVAETSLTVPRIRYVIDPGQARVNRYSPRLKVQRLHSEPISQASADQRKGRCGRVAAGVCYRLYSESDYLTRPRYTDPELKRSALAGVILRLLSLNLGAIEDFAFLDAPADRAIADGYQELLELGAIRSDRRKLTEIGRTLARLPIDAKLGRVLIEAARLDCLREASVIVAFLAVQDPRERPTAARDAADRAHAQFADSKSDFLSMLNLWAAYRSAHEELTQSKLREWCAQHFLSFLRMREWRELHRQLILQCQEIGWSMQGPDASYESLHRALLSGLPGQIGHKDDKGQYQGSRGRRFLAFPGSALAKHGSAWMLSAIYLDTARLYGLVNARVEPRWIEEQAAHLVKRRHFDPHWSRDSGRVMAYEQVTLFGLVLAERRRVAYGSIDAQAAHEIFIRDALLLGEIDSHADFVHANQAVLVAARAEEAKQRRHGLLKSDAELAEWLKARIPARICTSAGLDAWWRRLDAKAREPLLWTLDDVLASNDDSTAAFPEILPVLGRDLTLSYRFDPGAADDGVTLVVPLEILNALPEARLSWLVPGLLADKVAQLIRGLPKALRRNFVPAPDFARAFCAAVAADEQALSAALSAFLLRVTGVSVPNEAWDESELPAHLRMRLELHDRHGKIVASGRDLLALRGAYAAHARQAFARNAGSDLTRLGLTRFDFDELPEQTTTDSGLNAYPALVDAGSSVSIALFERQSEARVRHAAGVVRLLRLVLSDKRRRAAKQLALAPRAALAYATVDSQDRLRDDVVDAAFDDLAVEPAAAIRKRVDFATLADTVSSQLFALATVRMQSVEASLLAYADLAPKLSAPLLGFARASFDDLREQVAGLVYAGFARDLSSSRIAELPRFLKAMGLRIARLQQDPRKDQAQMLVVREFVDAFRTWSGSPGRVPEAAQRGEQLSVALQRLRWLIEEFRVQSFAQELKTREPVSEKRLRSLLQEIEALRS